MKAEIITPAPLLLDGTNPPGLRVPPRPPDKRQANYEEVFDFRSLWYDAFRTRDGEDLVLVAPPLLNLVDWFKGGRFVDGAGHAWPLEIRRLANCDLFLVEGGGRAEGIFFEAEGARWEVGRGDSGHGIFAGRRVLLTMIRNDELAWIEDWIGFHVERHGADAALIYNNGSTAYGNEELLERMAGVPGLETAVVVPWFFPYGADGGDDKPWDSNFCQPGGLEHAHQRLLKDAEAVLVCDVDELVVDAEGCSVFELCLASPTGYLQFPGRWCYRVVFEGEAWPERLRHRHHRHIIPKWGASCPMKWVIDPARIDPSIQWNVHGLHGRDDLSCLVEGLEYRHIRGISTSWKSDRRDQWGHDPAIHEEDTVLARDFQAMGW